MNIAILGGGISGLTAAYFLREFGHKGKIIILEGSNKLGGLIQTLTTTDGTKFELGPRTLRVSGNAGQNTLKLAENLNLQNMVCSISYNHPSAKNRYIKIDGKLHKLQVGIKSIFKKQPPFSKPFLFYVLQDLTSQKVLNNDESIYSFIQRRFGNDLAKYAIDPFCRGVFAGSAKELSAHSLLKSIYTAEQNYGSVIKGLLFDRRNKAEKDKTLNCSLTKKAKEEKWAMWSLTKGLQTLTGALENEIKKLNIEIKTCANITKLEFSGQQAIITYGNNEQCLSIDNVISCLPAINLKEILKDQDNYLYKLLNTIPYVSVAVVNLEYSEPILEEPGFGYLVPSSESSKVLGVIYDSVMFPQHENTIFTVMMGGYWFTDIFGNNPSKDEILKIALEEINNTFNVSIVPKNYKVNILRDCIPQYTVGHNERVSNMRALIKQSNIPLSLAGNSYDGVGVNDAIYTSKLVVKSLMQQQKVI